MTREKNERIPEDLRAAALAVVNRGYDEGLVDAVAAALLAERNAQRERDAKIAESLDPNAVDIAAAIRRSTLTQELADQAQEMDMGYGK